MFWWENAELEAILPIGACSEAIIHELKLCSHQSGSDRRCFLDAKSNKKCSLFTFDLAIESKTSKAKQNCYIKVNYNLRVFQGNWQAQEASRKKRRKKNQRQWNRRARKKNRIKILITGFWMNLFLYVLTSRAGDFEINFSSLLSRLFTPRPARAPN